jgi:hypothetical protein
MVQMSHCTLVRGWDMGVNYTVARLKHGA